MLWSMLESILLTISRDRVITKNLVGHYIVSWFKLQHGRHISPFYLFWECLSGMKNVCASSSNPVTDNIFLKLLHPKQYLFRFGNREYRICYKFVYRCMSKFQRPATHCLQITDFCLNRSLIIINKEKMITFTFGISVTTWPLNLCGDLLRK